MPNVMAALPNRNTHTRYKQVIQQGLMQLHVMSAAQ